MGVRAPQFVREVQDMLRRGGIDPSDATIRFTASEDADHRRSERRYASVQVDDLDLNFAHAMLELDAAHRRGIIAHEVGHILAWIHWRDGTEDGADRAACHFLNIAICYDHAWPGKGLQLDCGPCRPLDKRRRVPVS